MISTSPFNPMTVCTTPSAESAIQPRNSAEAADFSSVLNDTASAETDPDTSAPAASSTRPGPLDEAAGAARPGKDLPSDLPVTETASDKPAFPDATAETALAMRHGGKALHHQFHPTHAAEAKDDDAGSVSRSPIDKDTPDNAVAPDLNGEPVPAMVAIAVKPAEAIPVSRPLVATAADPVAASATPGQGAEHRTIPGLPDQASAQALAQVGKHRADAQDAAPRLPRPAEEIRVALALPQTAIAIGRRDARPRAEAMESLLNLGSTPQGASVTLSPPAPTVSPPPQVRPHDFAALIDRLSAAREALAPQPVSITLAHQEFGPVRLHFRPDDTGLNVVLSSPNPEFARAAAAAPPPVFPTAASDQADSAHQQRSDNSAPQQGTFAQSRGGSSDRREPQPQQQPSQGRQPDARSQRAAARQGIFA